MDAIALGTDGIIGGVIGDLTIAPKMNLEAIISLPDKINLEIMESDKIELTIKDC